MKIAIVCFTGNSGLTDYAVSISRALQEQYNCELTLITADTLPVYFSSLGIKVLRLFRRTRHLAIDYPRFLAHCLASKYDLIIFQGPLKSAFVDRCIVKLLRAAGIKCVITVHDVLPHYPNHITRRTLPAYYRSADSLIAHSDKALSELKKLGIFRPTTIVPHGIYDIFDRQQYTRESARQKLGLDQDKIVCLFFGNQEERKGLVDVANAASILKEERISNVDFVFAGQKEKNGSARYQDAINRIDSDLDNSHAHWGYAPFEEVEAYFRAADIVLLPYNEGTTSGVLKLAVAFEKPVIATNVGDFSEQLAYCYHHILPPNSPSQIAEAIKSARDSAGGFWKAPTKSSAELKWSNIAATIIAKVI